MLIKLEKKLLSSHHTRRVYFRPIYNIELKQIKKITFYSGHGSSRALSESMTSQSFQLAVSNVKNNLQTKAGTIFWPDNNQLWTSNVQVS